MFMYSLSYGNNRVEDEPPRVMETKPWGRGPGEIKRWKFCARRPPQLYIVGFIIKQVFSTVGLCALAVSPVAGVDRVDDADFHFRREVQITFHVYSLGLVMMGTKRGCRTNREKRRQKVKNI